MAKQGPARWDRNSEKIHNALEDALKKFGQDDGRVKGGRTLASPSCKQTLSGKKTFIPARAIPDDEFVRLKEWLDTLEEHDRATAYSAVLQIWLDHHGIRWPGKVFTADMAKAGRGRRVIVSGNDQRRRCSELKSAGRDWPAIAQEVFGGTKKLSSPDKASFARTARDYAKAYDERVERQSPLEPGVSDPGYEMLGLERYEDVLDGLNRPRSQSPR